MQKFPVLVLGLGNILMKDDGLGIYAIRELSKYNFSEEIEFVEGATSGISLVWELEGREKIVVVDAIKTNAAPGTLFNFKFSEVERFYKEKLMSLHQVDFISALDYADFLNVNYPDISFWGIEPEEVSQEIGLSPVVQNRLPELTTKIRTSLM